MFTFSKGLATHKHFLVMFIETPPSNAHDIRWGNECQSVPFSSCIRGEAWLRIDLESFTRLSINLVMFKWLRILCGLGHYLPYNETQYGVYDTLGWKTDLTQGVESDFLLTLLIYRVSLRLA